MFYKDLTIGFIYVDKHTLIEVAYFIIKEQKENVTMFDYPAKCIEEECGKPMPTLNLAEAFVKYQPYVGIVPLKEGLKRGSMFPNLYQPYDRLKKYLKR